MSLQPSVSRTFAPIGETPILTTPLSKERVSVIGALSMDGRLFTHMYTGTLNGEGALDYIKSLLLKVKGHITLVWDNAPIHKTKVLKAFLLTEEGKRLTIKNLPAYAPELNPIETVWHHRKNVQLKNVCCHDVVELKREIFAACQRIRYNYNVLLGCIRQPGCYN